MKQYKIKLKTKKTYEEDLVKLRKEFPEFDDSWAKVEYDRPKDQRIIRETRFRSYSQQMCKEFMADRVRLFEVHGSGRGRRQNDDFYEPRQYSFDIMSVERNKLWQMSKT